MKKHLPLLSIFLLIPKIVSACSVCFGGADGNLRKGFTWGVAILGILPFALMAGLISMIAYSIKKNKKS